LDDFLSLKDFGELATFTPEGGAARAPVPGIFDDAHFNAEAGSFDMDASDPRFLCKATDVVGLKKGAGCTIAGRVGAWYLVRDPKLDGTGMATVFLALA
jgi:hypothetical protein